MAKNAKKKSADKQSPKKADKKSGEKKSGEQKLSADAQRAEVAYALGNFSVVRAIQKTGDLPNASAATVARLVEKTETDRNLWLIGGGAVALALIVGAMTLI